MSTCKKTLLFCVATLLAFQAQAQQLNSDQPVIFDLPAQSFASGLFINVGANRRLLSVEVSSDVDVDLFFLYEDEFPTSGDLFDASDYYSGSATGNESIAIGTYNNPPLQAGTWRIGVLNFSAETATVTLTPVLRNSLGPSQIDIDYNMSGPDCDTAPWFDSSPYTNQGGNSANTLGQARRQALEEAIAIISEQLISPVPLILRACWQDIEPEGMGVTLAFAGPDGRILQPGFQGLTEPGAWYPSPAAVRLAGTDFCNLFGGDASDCNVPHLQATFNRLVDTNDALGSQRWWYGFNAQQGTGSGPDFVSTAAHEILHGLGFVSFVDVESGAKAQTNNGMPIDDVFSLQVEDYNNGNPRGFMDITNSQRAAAIRSNTDLRWLGFEGVNNDSNPYRNYQNGHPHLHAPSTVNPGSSLSHVTGEVFGGIPSFPAEELMRPVFLLPTRDLGISQFMMWDVGWNPDFPQQGGVIPEILVGNHYDRAFDGHGFELQRAGDTYFQLLYTYDQNGLPEFYVAAGSLVDGVFTANTIFRVVYNAANSPPQMPEPGSTGSSMIDFTVDESDPACSDGTNRSDAIYLGRWDWEIDNESGSWCIEPLLFASGTPSPNYTGSWYAGPSDDGWGLSIFHQSNAANKDGATKGGGTVLSAILYFYDSNGVGRWAIGSSDSFSASNNTLNMIHVDGYCRDCAPSVAGTIAGSLTLNLVDPSGAAGAGNTATVDVTFQGPGGGSWERNNAPIQLLSSPVEQ